MFYVIKSNRALVSGKLDFFYSSAVVFVFQELLNKSTLVNELLAPQQNFAAHHCESKF